MQEVPQSYEQCLQISLLLTELIASLTARSVKSFSPCAPPPPSPAVVDKVVLFYLLCELHMCFSTLTLQVIYF